MNPLLNILFMLLYVVAFFYFIVDVTDNNFLRDKMIVFIATFLFQYALIIINKVINKCDIDTYEVVNECLRVAFVGVVGYSIYTDLTIMDYSRAMFAPDPLNKHKSIWLVTAVIILLMTLTKTIELFIQAKQYQCNK
jgi:hypothetical protein